MVDMTGPKLPKWVEDYVPEAEGLSKVFGIPVDITETPPEDLDDNYKGMFLNANGTLKYVKVHSLTLKDIIAFKKANPDNMFVLSYDEENRKVRVS